ncbi:MAG: DUF4177 domain-containing protein [Chloroflexota bacterium]
MTDIVRWEYRVATCGSALSGAKDEELEVLLDAWGEEGWEVISVHNPTNSNKVRIVAKRRLDSTTRRQRTWPTY